MLRRFSADTNKLRRRHNRILFLLNIIPCSVTLTLLVVVQAGKNDLQPISYYRLVTDMLCICSGWAFFTVGIGSWLSTRYLKQHSLLTYVEIRDRFLLISRAAGVLEALNSRRLWQKVWMLDLTKLEEIYYYKSNMILIGPIHTLEGPSDALDFRLQTLQREKRADQLLIFDLYHSQQLAGMEIRNDFRNGNQICTIVEKTAGVIRKRDEERKQFRDRMLAIAAQAEQKQRIRRNEEVKRLRRQRENERLRKRMESMSRNDGK